MQMTEKVVFVDENNQPSFEILSIMETRWNKVLYIFCLPLPPEKNEYFKTSPNSLYQSLYLFLYLIFSFVNLEY